MKKILSVIILLAFVGTTIVMTGCLGGDDGIGAVIAAGFVIAIVASSGGASAPVVFAANQKGNIRTQISETADRDNVSIQIIPLKDGVEQLPGQTLSGSQLTWEQDPATSTADVYILKAKPKVYLSTSDEYKVKVLYNDGTNKNVVLEGVRHIASTDTSGATTDIDPKTTAKAIIYEEWKKSATQDTYKSFEYNIEKDTTNIVDTVQGNVETALSANAKAPDYSTATNSVDLTGIGTTSVYSVSGYVYSTNGTGANGAEVTINGTNNSLRETYNTTNGSFVFETIPVGSYSVSVYDSALNDTGYYYESKSISVTNQNITGLNFRPIEHSHAASNR